MVGTGRFELPTPRTPSECSTRLSHVPTTAEVFCSLTPAAGRLPAPPTVLFRCARPNLFAMLSCPVPGTDSHLTVPEYTSKVVTGNTLGEYVRGMRSSRIVSVRLCENERTQAVSGRCYRLCGTGASAARRHG